MKVDQILDDEGEIGTQSLRDSLAADQGGNFLDDFTQ